MAARPPALAATRACVKRLGQGARRRNVIVASSLIPESAIRSCGAAALAVLLHVSALPVPASSGALLPPLAAVASSTSSSSLVMVERDKLEQILEREYEARCVAAASLPSLLLLPLPCASTSLLSCPLLPLACPGAC